MENVINLLEKEFEAPVRARLDLPLFGNYVPAGFASPADDFMDRTLDLNEYIVQHPSSTFYVKVSGDSMTEAGIYEDDIIVVDRSVELKPNKVILALVNGEFTVKRYRKVGGRDYLFPENNKYKPMLITPEMAFEVWGVVIHVLHKV